MSSLNAKSARPELRRLDCWRVKSELLACNFEVSRCLQPCHVRTMSELSLGIAPNDIQIGSLRHIVCHLVLVTEDL